MTENQYARVLIKLSGEMLAGDEPYGINVEVLNRLAEDVVQVHAAGYQVGLVIGGGNIFRGIAGAAQGLDRTSSDYMGMLATVMNGLAVQNAIERAGVQTRVLSAIKMDAVAEPYVRRRAVRHMEKGRVIIFVAGTGNPFFTTDTAAALRAVELNCDLMLKATKVDGIYTADPAKDKTATHIPQLTYNEAIVRNLQVMDGTAITLCRDNHLSIMVASIQEKGGLLAALEHRAKSTLVLAEQKTEKKANG